MAEQKLTPEENAARRTQVGKRNMENLHAQRALAIEEKARTIAAKAARTGPWARRRKDILEDLDISGDWFRRHRPSLFYEQDALGLYFFDIDRYYTTQAATLSADQLKELFTTFFRDALLKIEKDGSFNARDLGFPHGTAVFFENYVAEHGWATKDAQADSYTWLGDPELKAQREALVADANDNGAKAGPELLKLTDLTDLFEFDADWFTQNLDALYFEAFADDAYYFHYKIYFEACQHTRSQEQLRGMFETFFKVALDNIARDGVLYERDLTSRYEMAPANAEFFMNYAKLHSLCSEDPHSEGLYYWGETQAAVEEPTPEPQPKTLPVEETYEFDIDAVPAAQPVEPHRYKAPSKDRPKKLKELLESALDLGAGSYTITRLCAPTSIKAYSFPHYRMDLPFIKRMPNRGKQYFDFQAYYNTIKTQTSGLRLAKLVERFFKKDLIHFRVKGKFSRKDMVEGEGMAPPNALFLVWYLAEHNIIETCCGQPNVYSWLPDPDIKRLTDLIAPPKEPECLPVQTGKKPHYSEQVWLCPTQKEDKAPPRKAPRKPAQEAVAAFDTSRLDEILAAITTLTATVEAQPTHVALAAPQHDNTRIVELENTIRQMQQLASLAEQALNQGQIIQAGAQVLQIKDMAMPGVSSNHAAPIGKREEA